MNTLELQTVWAPRLLSILRIAAALIFIAHGTQKLFGFPAPPASGLPPVFSLFWIGGILEAFGGLLLLAGRRTTLRALRAHPEGVDLGALRPVLPGRLQTRDKLVHLTPDLVLADLHLDEGPDGLDVVDALRHTWNRVVPAALITADRDPTLRLRARARQVELLHKPVKPAALRALLRLRAATAAGRMTA